MCNYKECKAKNAEQHAKVDATKQRILDAIKNGQPIPEDIRDQVSAFFLHAFNVMNNLPEALWSAAASGEMEFAHIPMPGPGGFNTLIGKMIDQEVGGIRWPGKPGRQDN